MCYLKQCQEILQTLQKEFKEFDQSCIRTRSSPPELIAKGICYGFSQILFTLYHPDCNQMPYFLLEHYVKPVQTQIISCENDFGRFYTTLIKPLFLKNANVQAVMDTTHIVHQLFERFVNLHKKRPIGTTETSWICKQQNCLCRITHVQNEKQTSFLMKETSKYPAEFSTMAKLYPWASEFFASKFDDMDSFTDAGNDVDLQNCDEKASVVYDLPQIVFALAHPFPVACRYLNKYYRNPIWIAIQESQDNMNCFLEKYALPRMSGLCITEKIILMECLRKACLQKYSIVYEEPYSVSNRYLFEYSQKKPLQICDDDCLCMSTSSNHNILKKNNNKSSDISCAILFLLGVFLCLFAY